MRDFKRLLTSLAAATMITVAAQAGDTGKDGDFFAAYDQVNSADIEIAELGAVNGASREVRAVAAMVLRDHAAVRQMARDIADRAGVVYVVPDDNAAAETHQAAFARLSALEGSDFDRAYLEHEAAFHRQAIDAVREVLIPSVELPAFQAHLEAVLPGFEHHLNATIEAADALGYELE